MEFPVVEGPNQVGQSGVTESHQPDETINKKGGNCKQCRLFSQSERRP
jgi:hypothetical protein